MGISECRMRNGNQNSRTAEVQNIREQTAEKPKHWRLEHPEFRYLY
jgi:hypothetical protein